MHYSDYILAQQPWSFCRLNEPVSFDCYLDSTHYQHDLFSKTVGLCDNNITITAYPGEPNLNGILIKDNYYHYGENQLDWTIHDTALRFDIPLIKSEVISYRPRYGLQQCHSAISSFWIDILLNPNIMSYHEVMMGVKNITWSLNETFIILGNICLVGTTTLYYENGTYTGRDLVLKLVYRYLSNGTIATANYWQHIIYSDFEDYQQFEKDCYRFTFGLTQPTLTHTNYHLHIDGSQVINDVITLTGEDSFELFDHAVYSNVAIQNRMVYSNIALFINKNFPNELWFTASQTLLDYNYHSMQCDNYNILHDRFKLLNKPGNHIRLFDQLLVYGQSQQYVKTYLKNDVAIQLRVYSNLSVTLQTIVSLNGDKSYLQGVWQIIDITNGYLILKPCLTSSFTGIITIATQSYEIEKIVPVSETLLYLTVQNKNDYSINDLVTINFSLAIADHVWRISTLNTDGFNITCENNQNSYNFSDNNCIIKKIPFGGGWLKTITDDLVGYHTKSIIEAYPKSIVLLDTFSDYTKVYLADVDNDNLSECFYLHKFVPNKLNKKFDSFYWQAIGDNHRFYLILPTRLAVISQSHVQVFGEIIDWFDKNWCNVVIANTNKNEKYQVGFNKAFEYPNWSIEAETGFLICKSVAIQANDMVCDTKLVIYNDRLRGIADMGYHVYPIDSPCITFSPFE